MNEQYILFGSTDTINLEHVNALGTLFLFVAGKSHVGYAGNKQVESVNYYNLQGVSSNEPFKGFNIKVTTYTDDTRTSKKVVRYNNFQDS